MKAMLGSSLPPVVCKGLMSRHKTKTNKTKNITQYMLDTTIYKTQDEDKQNKKTQHNICWTPPYTRHKMKTNKTKKHNTIYAGYHHTQDTR
jgi:hypothetical protein